MNIILFQPQIPQNTGNIIRTCKVTGANLILIEPFGFDFSDKSLKRAQLDYAKNMDIKTYQSLEDAFENVDGPIVILSSKGTKSYYDIELPMNTTLVFGNETSGLPASKMEKFEKYLARLPMQSGERCLNLSNAVAIATYEVLRQNQFAFSNAP